MTCPTCNDTDRLCANHECRRPLSRWWPHPLCGPCLDRDMRWLHGGYERGYGPIVRPAAAPPVTPPDDADEAWFDVREEAA